MKNFLLIVTTAILMLTTGLLATFTVKKNDRGFETRACAIVENSSEESDSVIKERMDELFKNTGICVKGKVNYQLLLKNKIFKYKQIEYSTNEILYILKQSFFTDKEKNFVGDLQIVSLSRNQNEYLLVAYADISKASKKMLFFAPKNQQFNASCTFEIEEKDNKDVVVVKAIEQPMSETLINAMLLLKNEKSVENMIENRLSAILQNIGYIR